MGLSVYNAFQLSSVKCALITKEQAGKIANQSFRVIKFKPKNLLKNLQVLLRYIQSDLAPLMIENIGAGAIIKMLKMKDLQDLIEPVSSKAEQDEIEQEYLDVVELTQKIKQLVAKINQSMKRHWSV